MSVPDLSADIYASTADPATVPSPSPFDNLLSPNFEGTQRQSDAPLTLAQVPLPPSVSTPIGSVAVVSGCTGLSVRPLRRHQTRDNLFHPLSVPLLANSPILVKAVAGRLSSVTRLYMDKHENLKALLLLDNSALSPNYVKDLISIKKSVIVDGKSYVVSI